MEQYAAYIQRNKIKKKPYRQANNNEMESNTIKINKQKLRKHYKQAARMKRLGKIAINRARVRIGNIEIHS